MQSLARRQCYNHHYYRFFINEFHRGTISFSSRSSSVLSDQSLINDADSSVLVEGNANSRIVLLNRPSVPNALNTPLMSRLHKLYESWEDNPNVGFVVMKGNGNAFCAGADIVSVRDMIKKGNIEGSKEIFRKVYGFAYLVHTYLKPNVFATPETLIGLHSWLFRGIFGSNRRQAQWFGNDCVWACYTLFTQRKCSRN